MLRYAMKRPNAVIRIDSAYCYRRSSVLCLSVGLPRSWALQKRLNRSRCRLGRWLGWGPMTRITWGPDPHTWMYNFEGTSGRPGTGNAWTCPAVDILNATQHGGAAPVRSVLDGVLIVDTWW